MSRNKPDEPDNKSAIKSDSSSPIPDPKKTPIKKSKPLDKQDKVEEVGLRKLKPGQKAEKVDEPTPKKAGLKKSRYEELPEIPDYEHPELEKYDPNEFDPAKKAKESTTPALQKLEQREPDSKPKIKAGPKSKHEVLPEIEDYERPELEKFEKISLEPTKDEGATPKKAAKSTVEAGAQEEAKIADKPKWQRKAAKPEEKPVETPLTKLSSRPQEKAEIADKAKAKKGAKPKYEELPEIEDYERPALEKYEKEDFEPTKITTANPPADKASVSQSPEKKEEAKVADKPKWQRKAAEKPEESVTDSTFKLKPTRKDTPEEATTPEESADFTINTPKVAPPKTSTEESADAKITPKKPLRPPTTAEESAMKNVVIRGKEVLQPIAEDPIEIKISEPEEETPADDGSRQLSRRASVEEIIDSATGKKTYRKKKYDPMAYIPDEDEEPVSQDTPTPTYPTYPNIEETPRYKYDPMRYIPDKDDLTSGDRIDDPKGNEVNINMKTLQTNPHRNFQQVLLFGFVDTFIHKYTHAQNSYYPKA